MATDASAWSTRISVPPTERPTKRARRERAAPLGASHVPRRDVDCGCETRRGGDADARRWKTASANFVICVFQDYISYALRID